MWFFKKKSAPYNLSTQLYKEDYPIHYSLYDGVRVSDQKEFSIFEIKADQSPFQQSLAQNAIKIWRTFRHPAIPLFIESYEYDGATYVVTNKLLPFDDKNLSDSELTWAIYVMADFVNFLSEDAKAVHGNIQDSALYMTYGHELKIAGLHWMTVNGSGPITDFYQEWSSMCQLANPKPPINSPIYSIDVRFIGSYLQRWESRLSRAVTKFYSRWNPNFKNPPSPQAFLSMEFWKRDQFIVTLTSLRDLPLKDQLDREAFFKNLPETLDIFSVETQEYTILPILLSSLSFSQTSSVLESISAIGQNISPDSFGAKIAPALLPLFESKDRNIRVHLLSQIGSLIHHFTDKTVNDTIFKNVVLGFNDTVVALKAATIVAMVSIAPHLNSSNLKTLLRELERLQGDQDGSIRCNSVICIAKIAEFIQPEFRSATLIACFTRAAKDSFAQTRKAAVSACKSCAEHFNEAAVAANIMPALSPLCIDQSIEVRCLALKQMREYVEMLSKDVVFEENESEQQKKVMTSPTKKAQKNLQRENNKNEVADDDDDWGTPIEVKKKEPVRPKNNSISRNNKNVTDNIDDDDDWGTPIEVKKKEPFRPKNNSIVRNNKNAANNIDDDDDWGTPIEVKKKEPVRPKNNSILRSTANKNVTENIDDDDDWGTPIEVKKKEPNRTRNTSLVKNNRKPAESGNNGNDDDDGWGSPIAVNVKKQVPKVGTVQKTKPSPATVKKEEQVDAADGWDDLDDEDFENAISVGVNKTVKQQHQPKKLSDQKEQKTVNSKNAFIKNDDDGDDGWGEPKVVPAKPAATRGSAPIKQVKPSVSSGSVTSTPELKNESVKPTARPVERKQHQQPARGKKIIIQKVDQGWDDDIDWD